MSSTQDCNCDANLELGESQRGSQIRAKGRRRPLSSLERLRASQREEEKLAYLSQKEDSTLHPPLDCFDEDYSNIGSQQDPLAEDAHFPLDIRAACGLLQLPPAIGSQFFESKLRRLHLWQADCLGKVIHVENEASVFQHAAVHNKSNKIPAIPNVVYSAPTSGGKTLVAMLLMLRRVVQAGGRALYILPLRATVVEKVNELTALVRPYNQSLAPEDRARHKLVVRNAGADDSKSFRASAANVLVCTVEKANLVLNDLLLERADDYDRTNAGFRRAFSSSPPQTPLVSVVVDEAHYLTDKVPLEMLLTKLNFIRGEYKENTALHAKDQMASAGGIGEEAYTSVSKGFQVCQVIAFSATLPNAAELAAWLDDRSPAGKLHRSRLIHKDQIAGSTMSGCVLFQAKERPTPLDLHVACGNNLGLLTLPQLDTFLADGSGSTVNTKTAPKADDYAIDKLQGRHSGKGGSSSSVNGNFGPPESNQAERKRFVELVLQHTAEHDSNNSSGDGAEVNKSRGNNAEGLLVFCGATRECEVEADAIAKARAAITTTNSSATSTSAFTTATAHDESLISKLPMPSRSTEVVAARRFARKAWERLELPPGTDPTLKPKLLALLAHGVAFYHAPMPQVFFKNVSTLFLSFFSLQNYYFPSTQQLRCLFLLMFCIAC